MWIIFSWKGEYIDVCETNEQAYDYLAKYCYNFFESRPNYNGFIRQEGDTIPSLYEKTLDKLLRSYRDNQDNFEIEGIIKAIKVEIMEEQEYFSK